MKLPNPRVNGEKSLEETISLRKSVREYRKEPLALEDLSQIIWSAQGRTGRRRRAAPSAGATYPLELYVSVERVEGMDPGLYKYDSEQHALEEIRGGSNSSALSSAALGQDCVRDAAAVLVFAAAYERTTTRYGRRGERYVCIDVGHASENVYLQCAALGIGTVAVGAFDDAEAKRVLGIEEEPLYMMPLGLPV